MQAWNIRSNAAYAAVLYSYHWASVPHDAAALAWVNATAFPFLSQVATFWSCYLTKTPVSTAKDGYQYYDLVDCDGDEGCAPQTNAMWSIVYVRRLFSTLLEMTAAMGRAPPPIWSDILEHMAPLPTKMYTPKGGEPMPVLSDYGVDDWTSINWGKQPGYTHALWPSEALSMSEPNATLLAAANNTFLFTNWLQDNGFSWTFAAAARSGHPPSLILPHWHKALSTGKRTNRLVAYGGLCSDSLGAVAFVHDMLVQGQEGFVRLFPAWPGD